MAEGSVSERRVRPIQDAAASGNWKQALQLCDKWAKKGEKSEQFLALKASILLKQADTAQHERGKQELIGLCHREPAITDVNALQQIQDALTDLSLHKQEGPRLWERAVAKNPQNQPLLMTWLHSSVAESNWLSAQKAAVALRKAFPKERKYEFWKTLFCYLIQKDSTLEENQRKLFGTLAYRFISKAAESVPGDKGQLLSSPEALQSLEELCLLVEIYLNTDRAREAVKLLFSDSLGVSSRFADEDPVLILHLLLDALEKAQAWNEAFDFCQPRLEADATVDFALWELILTTLRQSQFKKEFLKRAQTIASNVVSKFPTKRAGYLYTLSLAQADGRSDLKLLSICQQYYANFKTKAFCFEDLRRPISLLSQEEKDTLLDITEKDESAEDPQSRLTTMKVKYCFRLELEANRGELERFAENALQLYESCRRKSEACTEAGYLAAVTLIKIAQSQDISETTGRATQCEILLQIAMLLESCQKDQKHGEEYYPYLVLLIRVQQMLGFMNMAMFTFKKLSVKSIQFESVGYLLLNRISTLHPRQVGKITPSSDNGFTPLEQLDLALEILERSESTLTHQIREGLEFQTYSNLSNAIQMRSKVQRSINRETFAYEHLKARRLTGLLDEGGHPVPEYPFEDQRDFSFIQTYEISGQSPLQSLQIGPLPKERWLDAMSLYDKIFYYLRSEMQGHSATSEKALNMLKAALEVAQRSTNTENNLELTEAEAENLTIHKTLAKVILQPKDSAAAKQKALDESISQLEIWLTSKLEPQHGCVPIRGISIPSWTYLHTSFTALETFQAISLFLSAASKKTSKLSKALSLPKDALLKLQGLVTKAEDAVHKQAKDIKDTLNEAGVLGKLVDIVTGRSEDGGEQQQQQQSGVGEAVERLVDAARIETFCGEMKDSWEDALDGVLACKVKVFK